MAPFFGMHGHWTIGARVAVSAAVLVAVGMLTSIFNGRSPWYSAARQLIFGCLAAGAIPVVLSRKGAKQPEPCPDFIYGHRNLIERC
ncbi:MAG: VIT1/CCC1 transporter family protein [Steroidobacteraceae bacterium]